MRACLRGCVGAWVHGYVHVKRMFMGARACDSGKQAGGQAGRQAGRRAGRRLHVEVLELETARSGAMAQVLPEPEGVDARHAEPHPTEEEKIELAAAATVQSRRRTPAEAVRRVAVAATVATVLGVVRWNPKNTR